ncbi:hypothetical protein GGX14DRAFT_418645 [Mycena pura]|uniref:Uncharacterized protein n=1 Tax=Mycena pura TaxID=153505 RepID=A0AAD6YRM7_9AGAR|nr:hypothetical protein GGX14DRAFT_418645 [Mycena pura]
MFCKSKIGTITLFLLFVSQSALGRPHGPSTQLRIARAQVLVRHSYCATAVTVKLSGTATATAAATAITVKFGSATISTASSSSTTSDASTSVASDPSTAIASSLTPPPVSASTPQPPFSSVGASTTSSSTTSLAPSTTSITAPAAALAGTTTSPSAASTTSNLVNLQVFTGKAGGIGAPAVVASGDQFRVEGNSLFQTKADALGRSCDVQVCMLSATMDKYRLILTHR